MPTADELVEYYQGFDFKRSTPELMKQPLPAIAKSLEYFLSDGSGERFSSKTFLDYGGGAGIYCVAAESLGLEATLFDYDSDTVRFGVENFNLREGVCDWSALEDRQFDVIFSFHVVEHWNEVERNFESLLEKLTPNGKLILATPNARSIEKWFRPTHFLRYYKLWGAYIPSRWQRLKLLLKPDSVFCWDPPRHLLAWTPKAFKELGERFKLRTNVKVGYNGNLLYEPRNYVIKPLRRRLRDLKRLKRGRLFKSGIFFWEILSSAGMWIAPKLFPGFGEQLYVVYRR
ncbi:MAG: class I SAM-dependent methyltransferase [Puniceicoccaceae bacterium]